jgi:hypothetical protein
MPQLIVSAPGTETSTVDLHKPRTTLGRRADNDIVFADRGVSGYHCVLEREGTDHFVLADLGSTNGTFVNDQRIGRQPLRNGDVVAIANIALTFVGPADPAYPLSGAVPLPAAEVARVQLLNGSAAGTEVPLDKPVMTFGEPGLSVVALSHRRTGYFVACMDSTVRPLLNASPIGFGAVALQDADVIELAGTTLRFRAGSVVAQTRS